MTLAPSPAIFLSTQTPDPGRMQILARKKADQNAAALDPWTVVHFAAGLALGLMNAPFRGAMAASLGYELAEQVFERRHWGQELFETTRPESLPNAVADSLFFAAGHLLGGAWNATSGGKPSR